MAISSSARTDRRRWAWNSHRWWPPVNPNELRQAMGNPLGVLAVLLHDHGPAFVVGALAALAATWLLG